MFQKLNAQNYYGGIDMSFNSMKDADPQLKPHPFRYNYSLRIKTGRMIDSQYFVGLIYGITKEEYQFDALFFHTKSFGWNSGISFCYIPYRWNTIFIPTFGLDAAYNEIRTEVYNGQGPKEQAYTSYYDKSYSTHFKLGLVLKCRYGFILNPYYNLEYFSAIKTRYEKASLKGNLKLNLIYILKKQAK